MQLLFSALIWQASRQLYSPFIATNLVDGTDTQEGCPERVRLAEAPDAIHSPLACRPIQPRCHPRCRSTTSTTTTHLSRLPTSVRSSSVDGRRVRHLFPPLCRLQRRRAHGWVRAGQLLHASREADEVGLQLQAQLGEHAAAGGPQGVEQACRKQVGSGSASQQERGTPMLL